MTRTLIRVFRRCLRGVPPLGLVALLSVSGGAISCGKPPPPTTANVKAGDLPPEGDWTGVFYSPLYGYLHLVKEGGNVSGKWRTQAGDKWGELHGEVTGDLLKYRWVERKIGMVGPGATTEGRGYFKYYVPPGENVNHEIRGEWGLGNTEVGNKWEALRQRNMLPDFDSVMPDETERVNMPDAWDSEGPGPASSSEPEDDSGAADEAEDGEEE